MDIWQLSSGKTRNLLNGMDYSSTALCFVGLLLDAAHGRIIECVVQDAPDVQNVLDSSFTVYSATDAVRFLMGDLSYATHDKDHPLIPYEKRGESSL